MSTRVLEAQEACRYVRQMQLPQIGPKGQEKLKAAKVLCVGMGGLGSASAIYLASCGVGTLGLADFDRVEPSNLGRQILYRPADAGRPKLDAARERLLEIQPDLRMEFYDDPHACGRAPVLKNYDLILDGTDNFEARYLLNDAALEAGRPVVWASVTGFEGRITIFGAPGGPCYRCLHPEAPPPGSMPNCSEAGVLGAVAGTLGTLQAAEAIKWILGVGEPLAGRLLIWDALNLRIQLIRFKKLKDCSCF